MTHYQTVWLLEIRKFCSFHIKIVFQFMNIIIFHSSRDNTFQLCYRCLQLFDFRTESFTLCPRFKQR